MEDTIISPIVAWAVVEEDGKGQQVEPVFIAYGRTYFEAEYRHQFTDAAHHPGTGNYPLEWVTFTIEESP